MKKIKNPAKQQILWLYPSDRKKLKELAKHHKMSRSALVRSWIHKDISLIADENN